MILSILHCPQAHHFQDFMIQGGDFVHSDGTGVQNIYTGSVFPDENFSLKHDSAGLLSMANSGKDTNGCQFFITCAKCNFLDNKHVVFGRVIDGLLIVRKIENVPIGSNNKPRLPITISQCGQMWMINIKHLLLSLKCSLIFQIHFFSKISLVNFYLNRSTSMFQHMKINARLAKSFFCLVNKRFRHLNHQLIEEKVC